MQIAIAFNRISIDNMRHECRCFLIFILVRSFLGKGHLIIKMIVILKAAKLLRMIATSFLTKSLIKRGFLVGTC